MQVVVRIAPLRFGAADALFGVCHVCPRLIHRRRPPSHIGFGALNICLRNGDRAHQSRDFSPLVRNLSFESRLLRNCSLQSIAIRPVIDFVKQISLLHELVVAHIQTQDRTLHLRRDSDEVGEYLGIVGSRIVVHVIEHYQP